MNLFCGEMLQRRSFFENAEHAAALVIFWFKHQNRTFGAVKSFKGPVLI